MRRRLALAIACVALAAPGCPARQPAKTVPAPCPPSAPIAAPQPRSSTTAPGDLELAAANSALKAGDRTLAAAKLESIVAMGMRAPSREEALFTLGVMEALPDNPARNVPRARLLLKDVIASGVSPARSHAAEFILSLLSIEEEQNRELAELRSQIEASRGEMEGLKATLAQRETELRKIKEILLETKPGS